MKTKPAELTLPELLTDATLLTGTWSSDARTFTLLFNCLRCATDGSSLPDRTVELRCSDVAAIAIVYETSWPEQRPSELRVPPELEVRSLVPWPFPPQEVAVGIGAPAEDGARLEGSRQQWIFGDTTASTGATWWFSFGVRGGTNIGVERAVQIACMSVSASEQGRPLDFEKWAEQYNAWWEAWAAWHGRTPEHVDSPRRPATPPEAVLMELAFAVDLAPGHAGAEAETSSSLVELLPAVRVFFEAPRKGAFTELAQAYTGQSGGLDEVAMILERDHSSSGSWSLARRVVDSWIEGGRAHVRVLGVAFSPGNASTSDFARLTAWSFDLRKEGALWKIQTHVEEDVDAAETMAPWVQGWPPGRIRDALLAYLAGDDDATDEA